MGFIQIIELKASSFDELEALHDRWLADTEGVRTVLSERVCEDRDNPGTYVMIVEFPSYEAAMVNGDLPATNRIAEGLAALAEGTLLFRNLNLIRSD